ncbi:hypothetical protein KZJ38_07465 [Paraburkholderia edwinii]|uniref:DNA end-binding protein Ku n=1 Tax=Paraburkholderia edwinii TaxID=2861782 RepID=A0ABX8UN56_9BURK|nr:hypothetical protein [Paraburkholderia edwinii]QYD70136.1 hypothetical protein KZJ38_07465 [Paraburkholderia edwinii]
MDVKALAAKAKKVSRDFTKTVAGGGEYTPPAAGPVSLRFVGYYEIGIHEKEIKGVTKTNEKVQLVFELSGKNYPVKDNGEPLRMTITENLTQNVKSNIIKIFNKMNYEGTATHFTELLGNAYRGRIYHTEKEYDGKKVVYANLRNEDGYSITPPVVEQVDDEGNVTTKKVKVAEPVSELKAFVWDLASKEMWDAIYIEGEYEEKKDEKTGKVIRPAKSKNVIQETIMSAKNWIGSPMQVLLDDGEPDLGDEDDEDPEVVVEKAKTEKKEKPKAEPKAETKKTTAKKAPAKKQPEPEPEPEVEEDETEDDDDPLAEIE